MHYIYITGSLVSQKENIYKVLNPPKLQLQCIRNGQSIEIFKFPAMNKK